MSTARLVMLASRGPRCEDTVDWRLCGEAGVGEPGEGLQRRDAQAKKLPTSGWSVRRGVAARSNAFRSRSAGAAL